MWRIGTVLLVVWVLGAAVAMADVLRFEMRLGGVAVGSLTIDAQEAASYRLTGRIRSEGLAGLVRRVRYDAESQGRMRGGGFAPQAYAEAVDTGRRQSEVRMAYKGGVPKVLSYAPEAAPLPQDIDPASQGGTVDPLTTLYAVLRDGAAEEACQLDLVVFDGRRRSQVQVRPDGDLACIGEYRRLAGFSPKEMAERQRFGFRATLTAVSDGRVRVARVEMQTVYGKVVLKRQ